MARNAPAPISRNRMGVIDVDVLFFDIGVFCFRLFLRFAKIPIILIISKKHKYILAEYGFCSFICHKMCVFSQLLVTFA